MSEKSDKNRLQSFFIFALLILFLGTCIAMIYPFFTVILWTVFLYIIFRPLHLKVISKLDKKKKMFQFKRHLLAGAFAVGILLLIIIPVVYIVILLYKELSQFMQLLTNFLKDNPLLFTQDGPLNGLFSFFKNLGIDIPNFDVASIRSYLIQFTQSYSSKVLAMGTSILGTAGNFLISLLFVVFALYFCFLDGHYLGTVIRRAIPVKSEYMDVLEKKFTEITRNLFSGYILVALYQGCASFIIMSIFGVRGALLFSVVLMFASFIPLFGAAIVWLPIGLVLCVVSSPLKGILFILICGFCVSMLDNFLRPFLLKDRINVHPLIIFFAILGGIQVFGMNGLILGQLIVILFFTVLNIILNTKELSMTDDEMDGLEETP